MTLRTAMATTFRSLRVRNYRLYFVGQLVSVCGTWVQIVALSWLVYHELPGGDAFDVGVINAVQQVPMLFLGAWGGAVADRVDRRKALVITQSVIAVEALTLGVLTLTDSATLTNVAALALVHGLATVFDAPVRQVFVHEMVGPDHLVNAVGLNSAVYNGSRVFGPAVAGVLILTVGTGWCFVLNGLSFIAVIGGLLAMRGGELTPSERVPRGKGQVREGLRYLARTPALRSNLVYMLVIGIFALNFQVYLPDMAKTTFGGGAGVYSAMTTAMGIGAVIGALLAASRARPHNGLLLRAGIGYGIALLVGSMLPTLAGVLVALLLAGVTSITFFATSNALLQLETADAMRGRVLAVRAMTVLGTAPLGQPIAGWVTDTFGPRWTMGMGGVACLVTAAWFAGATGASRSATEEDPWEISPDESTTSPT